MINVINFGTRVRLDTCPTRKTDVKRGRRGGGREWIETERLRMSRKFRVEVLRKAHTGKTDKTDS